MADTIQTLRPNANGAAGQGGFTNQGGAASAAAALADGLDTTYVEDIGQQVDGASYSFGTFALPAGAVIHQVVIRMRVAKVGTLNPNFGVSLGKLVDGFSDSGGIGSYVVSSTTPVDITIGSAAGYLQTQSHIDLLTAVINKSFTSGGSSTLRVYEMYADVYYNRLSVVSAVTLTNLTTATPTVSWTYTDPESDAQTSYQVKVFRTSQADPTVAGALWDSGEVAGNATSVVVGTPIDAGAIFAYVRTKDAGNGGWSNWANATGTIAFTPAATPTALTAVPDNANARVTLSATYPAPGTGLSNARAYIDRSIDGGVTWQSVRIGDLLYVYPNGYLIGTTPFTINFWDYEAPPGVALQYRTRQVAQNAGGFNISSAYRTVS